MRTLWFVKTTTNRVGLTAGMQLSYNYRKTSNKRPRRLLYVILRYMLYVSLYSILHASSDRRLLETRRLLQVFYQGFTVHNLTVGLHTVNNIIMRLDNIRCSY